MKEQTTKFLGLKDPIFYEGIVGILCNQISWDFSNDSYLFEVLSRRGVLKRVFIPEHGLFGELQDQVPLTSTTAYKNLGYEVEFISLYGDIEKSLIAEPSLLSDLDALIIDLQDIGSRYYTFATTVSYIFDTLAKSETKLKVYVIDRPNPAGRQVEGTLLSKEYSSFVGHSRLPHRHGLTIGELCRFFKERSGGLFSLEIIALDNIPFLNPQKKYYTPDFGWVHQHLTLPIQPSPNIPSPVTPLVFSGQCLFEGTILSEGRGTTLPFEIFGAPFLSWKYLKEIKKTLAELIKNSPLREPGAILRPLRFIPGFHKFAGEVCQGFQIHLTGKPYHSLAYSIMIIRLIREILGDINIWRKGIYEFRSDKAAIELLAGDPVILDYMNGKESLDKIRELLKEGEEEWIRIAKNFLIYKEPLYRVEI